MNRNQEIEATYVTPVFSATRNRHWNEKRAYNAASIKNSQTLLTVKEDINELQWINERQASNITMMGTELKKVNDFKQQFRIRARTAQYNLGNQKSKNKLLVKNLKKGKKICDEVRKRLSVQMMCLMTVKDIDAALVRNSETEKLKITFHHLNIWVKGAGWRDVRTPFSRNNVKFESAYLLENMKEIIFNHLQGEQRRDVREMVPDRLGCQVQIPCRVSETSCVMRCRIRRWL